MDKQIVQFSKESHISSAEDSEETKSYYRWAISDCTTPLRIKFTTSSSQSPTSSNVKKKEAGSTTSIRDKINLALIPNTNNSSTTSIRSRRVLVAAQSLSPSSYRIHPRKITFTYGGNVDQKGKIKETACLVCEKFFPSEKAMFGHMSNHSVRESRGAAPPTTNSRSRTTSADSIDSVLDISKKATTGDQGSSSFGDIGNHVIKNWPTAKRGRKRQHSGHNKTEDQLEGLPGYQQTHAHTEVQEEMSRQLISHPKASHGEGQDEVMKTHRVQELETANLVFNSSASKKQKIDSKAEERSFTKEHIGGQHIKGQNLLNMVSAGSGKVVKDENMISPIGNSNSLAVFHDVLSKKRMTPSSEALEGGTGLIDVKQKTLVKFECPKCHKSFPSHQALGGHVSSHNKRSKNCSEITLTEHFARANETAIEVTQVGDSKGEGSYQCKMCDKSFDSGQALGGHQRCHRPPPPVVESPISTSSVVTSHVVEPSQTAMAEILTSTSSVVILQVNEPRQTGHVVLDFDINELPDINEDAGVCIDHAPLLPLFA
ncbi:hypothetical protein IFM89_005163 [Coptis chinensis]|uniref:C2H2-type domain-containing protein n=1 Tax=Coptis chinensis TaxID=261450 RepID=A0A835M9W0_9MAGN|nr:hypothetical protein IFM89_005163 [Coptis chinensis]